MQSPPAEKRENVTVWDFHAIFRFAGRWRFLLRFDE